MLHGCGGDRACPALSLDMRSLAAQATSIELDIYDAAAGCDGAEVARGAPSPLVSRHLEGGGGTTLQLPPGQYLVVLHAFDDGGRLLGRACEPELFNPGQRACLAVSLQAAPGVIVDDGGTVVGGDLATGGASDFGTPPGDQGGGTAAFAPQASGTTKDLYQAWSPGGGEAFVVGVSGTILHTSDDGATWQAQSSGTTQALESMWGSGPNDVYVVGLRGLLLHSSNAGASWQKVPVPTTVDLYDVWGSGADDVYLVGTKGQVLHGSGTNFTAVSLPGMVMVALQDVWGSSASDVYLFGGNGSIFHGSAAAGFTKQTSGTSDNLYYGWGTASGSDVWINSRQPAGTVNPVNAIYHTADNGVTWTQQLSTVSTIWAMGSTAGGDASAAGDQLLESTDRGAHWNPVTTAPMVLYGVGGDAVGGGVWAVGAGGTILHRP
jgi:photosystem II stability/assembly factor-like uncharacterized protein